MIIASPLDYNFAIPRQIFFGWGRRAELGKVASGLGRRALIVWGSRTVSDSALGNELRDSLAAAGVASLDLCLVSREPRVDDVDRAVASARRQLDDGTLVVAIGGGSAIDLAKAVAAVAVQDGAASVLDYLEGVGRGAQLHSSPLPWIAIPTTAGTGSEATKNAVLSSDDPPFKKSLRSDFMLPAAAIVDPELTLGAPPAITIHTGMDAITQLIESYISCRARPLPQALVRDVLPAALAALPEAVRHGASRPAREVLSHAALVSGMALANSGLGLAHGVAAALGVHAGLSHGLACAAMLPIALRVNRSACAPRLADLERCVLASEGSGSERSSVDDDIASAAFVSRIEQLGAALGLPRKLGQLGVQRQQIPLLVRDARGNSMDGNPRTLSDRELTALLEEQL